MNKYRIIAIMGPAGSGKDYLVKKLYELYPSQFNRVVSATTRPPRAGEVDGIDYMFMTEEEFNSIQKIEETFFNDWHYGTPLTSLSADKLNLLVVNPTGAMAFSKRKDCELKLYHLDVPKAIRVRRQEQREEEPNYKEIVGRLIADDDDFSPTKLFELPLTRRLQNVTENDLNDNILTIIKDNFKKEE